MKQTIFVATVIVFFGVSCVKKPAPVNCWTCVSNDSVSSNIPALNKPHYKGEAGETCQLTEAQKDFYVKKNTKIDTLFWRNDTIQIEHWTMNCDVDY